MKIYVIIILVAVICVPIFFRKPIERALKYFLLSETKEETPNDTQKSSIYRQIGQTLIDQWYAFFFIAIMLYVVFGQQVGYDMLEAFIEDTGKFGRRLIYLSVYLFIFALAIWLIPYWILEKSTKDGNKEKGDFIVKTILICFISLLPYGIIAIGFSIHVTRFSEVNFGFSLLLFLLLGLVFLLAQKSLREIFFIGLQNFDSWLGERVPFFEKTTNYYIKLVIFSSFFHYILIGSVFLLVNILTLAFDFELEKRNGIYSAALTVYMLINGLLSFLLFYNIPLLQTGKRIEVKRKEEENAPELPFNCGRKEETKNLEKRKEVSYKKVLENQQEIDQSYEDYFDNSRAASRWTFIILLTIFSGINLGYFWSSSISHINTLFVLLSIFGLNILIVNLLRNMFKSTRPWKKAVSLSGMIIFFTLPFYSPDKQFNTNLTKTKMTESFEKILLDRLETIDKNLGQGPIYIVCGQGGGSRAGYVTIGTLEVLAENVPDFYNRTLMYSTISGSSPGVYHYLKANTVIKGDHLLRREVYKNIYRQNYNTGSVFGFFTGDNLDAITFGALNRIIKRKGNPRFYDRNERIKYEYDLAMYNGIEKVKGKKIDWENESYIDFFKKETTKENHSPLHLINTFEVNSGRRAVLTPGRVNQSWIFPNAILPLQDIRFVRTDLYKDEGGFFENGSFMDIDYRSAVNLSELFPFLSAAETLNERKAYQFVDGGYYENYGLTTALDVYRYIEAYHPDYIDRIQIVLIKNSLQRFEEKMSARKKSAKKETENKKKDRSKREGEKKNKKENYLQLTAPLRGIIHTPFTGYANYMDKVALSELGSSRYKVITFNEVINEIPLTRGLTEKHLNKLDNWIEGDLIEEIKFDFCKEINGDNCFFEYSIDKKQRPID